MRQKVIDFLKKHNMYYMDLDFVKNTNKMVEEMTFGLEGKESSLLMIPTYIQGDKLTFPNESIIALDAGGTNFRVSVVSFDENRKINIDYFKKYPMPGTKGPITKEEFFNTLADYIKPALKYSDKIGFCFSFSCEILENKDGKILGLSKEIQVSDAVGQLVGESLLRAFKNKGLDDNKSIVILNDTVAALLGGKAISPFKNYSTNVGFILGTGTNLCYIEENEKITKNKKLSSTSGYTIINVESGGYDKVPAGDIDDEFDQTTKNPGEHRLEKMVSGAYQGPLFSLVIKKAFEEGVLSKDFKVNAIKDLNTKDINDFLINPHTKNHLTYAINNEEDRELLYYLLEMLTQRAAKIATMKFAAAMVKTNTGKSPCAPACIAVEGTTFYLSKTFLSKFEYYINKYIIYTMGLYVDIVKSEDLVVIGTAIAGSM